ncbi:MAG: DegT/DnrJ/EryC1/StrS family aminotransferase [Nitrospinae bacterium]|nr:DegT/DnrJ/EryC1/StrS family aminotransferase [Nitrospinota bacterium]
MIKEIPLSKVYVDDEIKNAALKVLDNQWYILGEESKKLEIEFAEFIGTKYAILTSSGTSALTLSLIALGVKDGDEILVPSLTAFPTVEPIFHCRAKPVFIDVDDTYTIDSLKIEERINSRTVGIIPVHLYGYPANIEEILKIANKHGLFILEDCCQAHNARFKEKKVGSFGIAGCFSFYPSKNMTVCGDGGIVTTNNKELADKIRKLRDHGRRDKYVHEVIGFNDRFNEIQATIGRIQLKKLEWFTERRREIAKKYIERLKELPPILPNENDGAYHVYHLFVIRCDNREKLMNYLKQNGIGTGIHYPVPCHLQPAIKEQFSNSRLPITEEYCNKILSLPMYPLLLNTEVDYICEKIKEFFKGE